jgi:precorrin-6A/cobalt-precorrin-6A reductase
MASPDLRQRLWLIGGTQESAELAKAIAQAGLPCVVTVTTESARSLYPPSPNLTVWVGRLDPQQLELFLQAHQIGCVLDASHPFAIAVSQLAIAAAQNRKIPYLRYERQGVSQSEGNAMQPLVCDSFDTLLAGDYLRGRVLLTIGYRSLPLFQPWHDRATLFARILPSAIALETALAAGFTADRLIALRPPISADLERALWQQWQISMVITKASGAAGGEDVKRQVAAELGMTLVTIDRPAIDYPQQTSDLRSAVAFCQQSLLPESV